MRKSLNETPVGCRRRRGAAAVIAAASIAAALVLAGCTKITPMSALSGGSVPAELSIQQLPSVVDTLSLEITGPGMEPVYETFSRDTDAALVEVPTGLDRTFSLAAKPAGSYAGAILDYVDGITIDVTPPGINLSMAPEVRTKIVVPDYLNGRVVQVDNMSGTNWRVNTDWDNNGQTLQSPSDVAVDSLGTIYAADTVSGNVVKLNDISETAATTIITGAGYAVAVDRDKGLVYGGSIDTLFRATKDGSGVTQFAMSTLFSSTSIPSSWRIVGITTDDHGMVYIAHAPDIDGVASAVSKIDPTANAGLGSVVAIFQDPVLADCGAGACSWSGAEPFDVTWKDGFVYVTNPYGTDGAKILKLNEQLELVDQYGGQGDPQNPQPGNFYTPRRFVATMNKKITVTDDEANNNVDRLVSFTASLDGSVWETYGTFGGGTGNFDLFDTC